MLKTYVILFLLCLSFISCSKDKETNQDIPAALQTSIDSFGEAGNCSCLPIINQYNWKGQTVYVLSYRGPACNWIPAYYNEKGEPMPLNGIITYDRFLAESQLVRKVWSCE